VSSLFSRDINPWQTANFFQPKDITYHLLFTQIHPILKISVLQSLTLTLLTIQTPRYTHSSYLYLSWSPVLSYLKFCCNRSLVYAAPALWNVFPKDLCHCAHSPILPLNFTTPSFALSSATFHSWLKPNSARYSILILLLCCHRPQSSQITAIYHHTVSSAWHSWIMTWHRSQMRSLAIVDMVNELIALTWLL